MVIILMGKTKNNLMALKKKLLKIRRILMVHLCFVCLFLFGNGLELIGYGMKGLKDKFKNVSY
jgi:hypothetical protein